MTELDKKEKRRRAAIASILRRRNRSRKPRANSGASETSWAEYGPVTFTPGSDRSWAQKLGLFVLLIVGLFIPVFLLIGMTGWLNDLMLWFKLNNEHSRFAAKHTGFWATLFPFLLYAVLAMSAFVITLISITSLFRIIKSNIKSNER